MHKKADFRNGQVHYSDTGKGRAVVLLHGFLESMEMWRYYHNLPKKFRIICIDLPGHGKTENFGYVHDMELMAEAVHAVLKSERLRKVVIIGHSMGGYVGLAFAEKYPDMMKGLSLFFSTAAADSKERKINREKAIKLVSRNKNSFIKHAIPMLFAPQYRNKYQKSIAILTQRAQKMGVQNIIAAIGGMKIRSDREIILKFSPFPVHFISGDIDPVIPISEIRQQAKIGDNTSLLELSNTGHMGFIENKKETFYAVKYFLQRMY